MSDKDQIKELFQSKLGNLETPVDPSLWVGIQSQLPAAGTIAAKGLSIFSKVLIGLGSAAAITAATIIALNSENNEDKKQEVLPKEQVVENVQEGTDEIISNGNNNIEIQEIITSVDTEKETNESSSVGYDELNNTEEFMDSDFITFERSLPVEIENDRLAEEDDPYRHEISEQQKKEVETPQQTNQEVVKEATDIEQEKDEQRPTPVKIELKNIFTPNGDYDNDELFLADYGLKDFNLVVLDSRNKVVYQTNNPEFRWNGTDERGVPVPDGNYIYMVTAYDSNGLFVKASSMLKIVR